MSDRSVKQQHDLYRASSPDAFVARLEAAGISMQEVLSPIRAEALAEQPVGLLLTGSITVGLGSAASDVDLLLLSEKRLPLALDDEQWSYSRGADHNRCSLKRYVNGIELCLDLLSMDRMQALGESVDQLIAFSRTGQSAGAGLPVLEDSDLKLLHQLRTGWVLQGQPEVERWRQRFGCALLPLYLAINNFVLFKEYFEDFLAHRTDDDVPGGALHLGRMVAQSAGRTVLAMAGESNPNPKWLVHLLQRVADRGGALAALARKVLGLLFPARTADAAVVDAYVAELRAVQAQLDARLKADPSVARMLQAFEAHVHYVGVN